MPADGVLLIGLLLPRDFGGGVRRIGDAALDPFGRWDGIWYQRIADYGYDPTVAHGNGVAFSPLYPMLVRETAYLLGSSYLVAGMLVFFMNLGFALVETGLTRSKNAANILGKNFICFAIAACCVYAISITGMEDRKGGKGPISMETLLAGLKFIFSHKVLLGSISLDLVAVLFGGATALLPIVAKDVLHTDAWGLGLLRASPAVGSLALHRIELAALLKEVLDAGEGLEPSFFEVTTVATQALFLMNNPFIINNVDVIAKRLLSPSSLTEAERIENAYLTVLGRKVTADERKQAMAFLHDYRQLADAKGAADANRNLAAWTGLCHVLLSTGEFRYVY